MGLSGCVGGNDFCSKKMALATCFGAEQTAGGSHSGSPVPSGVMAGTVWFGLDPGYMLDRQLMGPAGRLELGVAERNGSPCRLLT